MIVNNGRPVNKSVISSLLWEDACGPCARDSLYKTYAYLKKFLRIANVCPVNSITNKLLLQQELISCDLWEFEKLYKEKNLKNWEKAETLYKGALFGGEAYSWLIDYEGRYEMMYFEILEYLLDCCKAQRRMNKVRYYESRLEQLDSES